MKQKPMIAFFGIDGSGKTTLLAETKKKFEKSGEKVKIVYMGLGSEHNIPLSKEIMKLSARIRYGKKGLKKWDIKKFRKYNYRQRGFLWVLGQYLEFWARYKKAKKQSKEYVILFDRFFYDGLILGSKGTFNFFKHFTPKISKSFLIKAPAKTIFSRKNEAGIKDIENYYNRAERLISFFSINVISNTKSIKKVVDEIWRNINDKK
jgi:thymidylate kinase